MNLSVSEWSGEVRSVNYSPNGETVTVVYRVTLHGTDAEVIFLFFSSNMLSFDSLY